MDNLKKGLYKHYKGTIVRLLHIANNSETLEKLVVYEELDECPPYPKGTIWVRPLTMFRERVRINNTLVPRFRFLI